MSKNCPVVSFHSRLRGSAERLGFFAFGAFNLVLSRRSEYVLFMHPSHCLYICINVVRPHAPHYSPFYARLRNKPRKKSPSCGGCLVRIMRRTGIIKTLIISQRSTHPLTFTAAFSFEIPSTVGSGRASCFVMSINE